MRHNFNIDLWNDWFKQKFGDSLIIISFNVLSICILVFLNFFIIFILVLLNFFIICCLYLLNVFITYLFVFFVLLLELLIVFFSLWNKLWNRTKCNNYWQMTFPEWSCHYLGSKVLILAVHKHFVPLLDYPAPLSLNLWWFLALTVEKILIALTLCTQRFQLFFFWWSFFFQIFIFILNLFPLHFKFS